MREMEYSINYLWDVKEKLDQQFRSREEEPVGCGLLCRRRGKVVEQFLVRDCCTDRGYVVGFVASGRR